MGKVLKLVKDVIILSIDTRGLHSMFSDCILRSLSGHGKLNLKKPPLELKKITVVLSFRLLSI